ncbi:hypothetical protein EDD92_0831 [Streptomyces sp. TLI_185]|nr:hypothetical protein EDD92_0831 [Streptomyces sp. TLI_185]
MEVARPNVSHYMNEVHGTGNHAGVRRLLRVGRGSGCRLGSTPDSTATSRVHGHLLCLRRAIDGAAPGTVVPVTATDLAAPLDLPAMGHLTGDPCLGPLSAADRAGHPRSAIRWLSGTAAGTLIEAGSTWALLMPAGAPYRSHRTITDLSCRT